MKKVLVLLFMLFSLSLAGCEIPENVPDPNSPDGPEPKNGDSTEEPIAKTDTKTLAYSTYLAGSLLSQSEPQNNESGSKAPTLLNTETEAMTKIEQELGDVSTYFNRLRVFLDHGLSNPFTIEDDLDVNEDYAFEMRYTVEENTYTLLFNEDEDGVLNGILITSGKEFTLSGERESENEDGESEEEIYLKTIDNENENNFIEIEMESSIEDNENAFEMALHSVIDGVEKELSIEFESEEGEASIAIETENGNSYSFERESEDDGVTEYYFEYEIDSTEGEVELVITRQNDGSEIYTYTIEEDGNEKVIEETEDDDDDEDETDDTDDDEEEGEDDSLSL